MSQPIDSAAERGKRAPAPPEKPPTISYSENAEDVRLLRVFRDVEEGFYVDIGAADPSFASVTRLFYARGWRGINVDPGLQIDAMAVARPRDVNVRAVIGGAEGEVQLEGVILPKYRLETVLREHAAGRTIHFLRVGLAGVEAEVLASSDWELFRPIVVVVDAIDRATATLTHGHWEHVLNDAGYELAAFDGINRFYLDEAHSDLADALAYPVSTLDRVVRAREREQASEEKRSHVIDGLRRSLHRTKELLSDAKREQRRLAAEVERLRAYENALDLVFQSPTWRAGRAVAFIAAPARAVGRRTRLGLRRDRRLKSERPLRPEQVYATATGEGKPWHFPRRRSVRARRARSALDTIVNRLGPPEIAINAERALELGRELEKLGWTDDESLLSQRLSWFERQAIVETSAVLRLVTATADGFGGDRPAYDAASASAAVLVDARCLQEPVYRTRGVGRHASTVLAAARATAGDRHFVLLTSPELPPLEDVIAERADRVVATPYALRDLDVGLFVELSPMTASAAPTVPFLASRACAAIGVVYDFIPSKFPAAYLQSGAVALANRVRLEALRHYDLLLPISRATDTDCRRILGDGVRTSVTGVGDTLSVVTAVGASATGPLMHVPGGGDARKNVPAALAALARYREESGDELRAVVTGALTSAQEEALDDVVRRLRLTAGAVERRGAVTESELDALYRVADLVFVPSLAEGFSIPVAEAVLRGTPVVASDIAPHRELVGAGPWLADPTDVEGLAQAIARVKQDPDGTARRQRQTLGDIADRDAVVARVTTAFEAIREERRKEHPARHTRNTRPRVALVAPFPPQRSGVADYTAFTFAHVAKYVDLEVYTAAPPADQSPFPIRPISAEPYLTGRFDAVVNVVGNSHFHFPVLDLLATYGGACIAHDNRMAEAYRYDRGEAWTAELLSTDSVTVRAQEVDSLLLDLDQLPSIGYDLIAAQASPLVVHGRALADRILRETGVKAVVVPFVPYNVPHEPITEAVRARARDALGLRDDCLHVATFGVIDRRTKGVDLVVGAAAWLITWGIPTHLHIVGDGPSAERQLLDDLASELGVSTSLTQHGHVPRPTMQQFLVGVDAAVQLRTSSVLSLSGALTDCVAFGVPTVTTDDLAEELETPSYVIPTGAAASSLLIAEAVDRLRDHRRTEVKSIEAERADYLTRRSPDAYAQAVLAALGLRPR